MNAPGRGSRSATSCPPPEFTPLSGSRSHNRGVIALRPRVGMGPALAALGAALFLAVGVVGVYRYGLNYWTYRGYAPPRDPAWVRERGTPARFYLASPALGGRRQPVDVYLPPGYARHPRRRYPVLYLLHGTPGRPGAFFATVRLGVLEDELVARRATQPVILVAPFGSTGTFTDEEWVNGADPRQRWESFVVHDLVRAVDRRYRTIRRGTARGIAGLSEGGYGAINIALHHPGEFHVVESWSGYERAFANASVFGRRPALVRANSPLLTLAGSAPTLRRLHTFLWFYSGTNDRLRGQNAAFAAELAHVGVAHRYFVVRGGHDWSLWRDNAGRALAAAARRLHA
jgi:enterochelin esterase-like enzyme